eukprot:TRINITY_DN13844_c0_g1_i1.p1 TRINITY_DN13844_c0_g1~~TRINITY_DN13844_c0_g1_i1.p1  ORF type:complete len:431 (+),score=71.23 TRINITY_DN13844_c0_g1_i1:184-1293(+)
MPVFALIPLPPLDAGSSAPSGILSPLSSRPSTPALSGLLTSRPSSPTPAPREGEGSSIDTSSEALVSAAALRLLSPPPEPEPSPLSGLAPLDAAGRCLVPLLLREPTQTGEGSESGAPRSRSSSFSSATSSTIRSTLRSAWTMPSLAWSVLGGLQRKSLVRDAVLSAVGVANYTAAVSSILRSSASLCAATIDPLQLRAQTQAQAALRQRGPSPHSSLTNGGVATPLPVPIERTAVAVVVDLRRRVCVINSHHLDLVGLSGGARFSKSNRKSGAPIVSKMIEAVHGALQLGLPPETCLRLMEGHLTEIVGQALIVAQHVVAQPLFPLLPSPKVAAAVLLEPADMPLIVAVAEFLHPEIKDRVFHPAEAS